MSPELLNLQVMGVRPVRHKPTKVLAARIHDNNIRELAEYIRDETNDRHAAYVHSHEVMMGGTIHNIPRLYLKCDKGQSRVADLGDVLIRGVLGEFYAITYEVFLNTYEDIPQEG